MKLFPALAALALATAPAVAQTESISCQADYVNEYTGRREQKVDRGSLTFIGEDRMRIRIFGQSNTFTFVNNTRLRDQNGTIWTYYINEQGFVFGQGDLTLICAPGHY